MDLVVSGILNFLTEQEAIGKADEVQDFYRYGIEITISSMLNIVLVLLMGALTGHLLESVIYLAVFIAVRVITGGYHADTYFRCNLLMCSTFIATAFLNDNVSGRSGVLYEPCLAAVGTLAGVENPFALALFCGFAAVPVVAELINDMTVADNLSAASCALLVTTIA